MSWQVWPGAAFRTEWDLSDDCFRPLSHQSWMVSHMGEINGRRAGNLLISPEPQWGQASNEAGSRCPEGVLSSPGLFGHWWKGRVPGIWEWLHLSSLNAVEGLMLPALYPWAGMPGTLGFPSHPPGWCPACDLVGKKAGRGPPLNSPLRAKSNWEMALIRKEH